MVWGNDLVLPRGQHLGFTVAWARHNPPVWVGFFFVFRKASNWRTLWSIWSVGRNAIEWRCRLTVQSDGLE